MPAQVLWRSVRDIARDAANRRKLRQLGWSVYTVWECRINHDIKKVLKRLWNLREAVS